MTPEQFVYWLQGYAEISRSDMLTEDEWKVIKDHLQLVFDKVTPDRSGSKAEKDPDPRKIRSGITTGPIVSPPPFVPAPNYPMWPTTPLIDPTNGGGWTPTFPTTFCSSDPNSLSGQVSKSISVCSSATQQDDLAGGFIGEEDSAIEASRKAGEAARSLAQEAEKIVEAYTVPPNNPVSNLAKAVREAQMYEFKPTPEQRLAKTANSIPSRKIVDKK
jgi:hypothetical protein